MRRLTIIILLAAAAGMVSCSAVRHCQAPDVDLPERIAGEDSDSLTVADVQWWRFYGDSTLCRIIERTLDTTGTCSPPPRAWSACGSCTG